MGESSVEHHSRNIKRFAILLLIVEIAMIVLYGIFVRINRTTETEAINSKHYPAYQDVNVMMLIGFGFLMAFSKSFSWSAIAYTFFMNAILPQLYILLSSFWKKVLQEGFHSDNYYIYVDERTFTLGLYSAASMFVSLGCIIGRVGPFQLLILCIAHEIGYTLNEEICYGLLKGLDVGGSTAIHTYGAYAGLTTSFMLSRISQPLTKPHTNYNSNIFAFIGTLFLWMYWPSFNYGVFATTAFSRTQIISNTIISLVGSCLATYMTAAFVKSKFNMQFLLNATLAGGVIIGAASGLLLNPGGALLIGFIAGIVSTLGFHKLTPYLQQKIGLFDTCGVNNLHGIPGVLGGLISAIICAMYAYGSTTDAFTPTSTEFPEITTLTSTPYKQGGIQVAITFISLGIGVVTSLISGLFLKCVYQFKDNQFFTDAVYFDEAEQLLSEQNTPHTTNTGNSKLRPLQFTPHSASLEHIKP